MNKLLCIRLLGISMNKRSHLSPIMLVLFASIIFVPVKGQNLQGGVIVNTDENSAWKSSDENEDHAPRVNPLPAPDTSNITLDPPAKELTPGTKSEDGNGASFSPRAYDSFGIPYTPTRVALGVTNQTSIGGHYLSSTYPYSAVGKLTYDSPTGTRYCSASLIRRSIIVTAAHCIQDFGDGRNIFSNWRFTPGYYRDSSGTTRPYGQWTWRALNRPVSWSDGTDIGIGAARENDLALILLNRDSNGRFVGDLTGYFSYGWNNYSFISSSKTGDKVVGATSTFGYPGLVDNGDIMQRTDGPTYTTTIEGAKQLMQGNNVTAGSSGGPWIVNFRSGGHPTLSGGAQEGKDATMAIIGVTSWGASDPNNPKDNFSSQFGQNTQYPSGENLGGYGVGNIGTLMYELCTSKAPGSTQTFEQIGYCN